MGAIEHCGPWERDGYKSIQVDVDARGCNIVGDAANEPSIAVSVTDPRKIVIGWRQFDSVLSDFRQAGWAYSHDAGHTWVFTGSLTSGVFGSDPVLGGGPDGEIYFLSLGEDELRLFQSLDGGITWGHRSQVSPGFLDKPWMAIDTTNGIGRGNIYIVCSCGDVLWRSTDGGNSWTSFACASAGSVKTVHVGPTGAVYVMAGNQFSKSEDAKDATRQPTWVIFDRDSGSSTQTFYCVCGLGDCLEIYPNPDGLLQQPWVVEALSNGAPPPSVYVLKGFSFDATGVDPSDLMFISSGDGGITWNRPVLVNDDPPRCNAVQWFGMLSAAPNGRIDVVWNDTRNSGQGNLNDLFYSFSTDTGKTWSTNVAVSPVFDTHVGWPSGQYKIGDYYHMVSDNLGANVAYAATFNGEQDIYFLRIGPWDCNGNEIDDALDISEVRSRDCNDNSVPDECEYRADANGDGLTNLADYAAFFGDLTGPGGTAKGLCSQLSDIDHDGDVDLHDFYLLSHVFTAP